jgi:hypothetical protein
VTGKRVEIEMRKARRNGYNCDKLRWCSTVCHVEPTYVSASLMIISKAFIEAFGFFLNMTLIRRCWILYLKSNSLFYTRISLFG